MPSHSDQSSRDARSIESNGGQQRGEASCRRAHGRRRADLNIGNASSVSRALAETCYFLNAEEEQVPLQLSTETEQASR